MSIYQITKINLKDGYEDGREIKSHTEVSTAIASIMEHNDDTWYEYQCYYHAGTQPIDYFQVTETWLTDMLNSMTVGQSFEIEFYSDSKEASYCLAIIVDVK